ncbi:MAG: ribosomal L7Ae/L30e/S12e/Gadd45 family protein [Candidatus ainarchaeum sp.]|nr:ribosomal L7Ae/L30e/S12e/Gadd45 family protein [Candidatus ainarchaeum sp.]
MAEYIKVQLTNELKEETKRIVEKSAKGKIKAGLNEVTKAIERGTAKLIVIAEDVTPAEIIMHIPILCKEKNITCSYMETKKELGEKAGLRMATSAIAIIESSAEKEIKDLSAKIEELKK